MVNQSVDPPKQSPSFEDTKKYFYSLPESKYEEAVWNVLYVCAATYSTNKVTQFKEIIGVMVMGLANKGDYVRFMNKWNINAYLTNNKDIFLYIYLLQQQVYKNRVVLSPFLNVKAYYFAKVGEECKDCKV